MKCDTCGRTFCVRPVHTEYGAYCCDDCALDGAEADECRPCPHCLQYHDGQCSKTPARKADASQAAPEFILRNDPPAPPKMAQLPLWVEDNQPPPRQVESLPGQLFID